MSALSIHLDAAPGAALPAPLPVLGELVLAALDAELGIPATLTTDPAAAARRVVFGERPDLRAPDVLWAGLLGPGRRPGPLPFDRGVRVQLDADPRLRPDLTRPPPPGQLGPAARASFGRLARALAGRRVGVALGAGGAWGYAHVPLLLELRAAGVPIDALAGSSFGALVAAYDCARGPAGLAQLVAQRRAVSRAAWRAFLSPASLERLVDRDLDGARLEDLATPLLAVAFDLERGALEIPAAGPVARAVRHSGSFPGLFGPSQVTLGRLADGCVGALVPDRVFGPDFALVIASNVMPPPPPRPPPPAPRGPLAALSPLGRARDLLRAGRWWAHRSGETGPAQVRFHLDRVDAGLWNFGQVDALLERVADATRQTAADARARWQALARPAVAEPP